MTARENLRDRVNALVKEKEWNSHKPAIEASGGRLSNGVLGRIRGPGGENVSLDKLDALAEVFGLEPYELLIPTDDQGAHLNGWPLPPELLAALQNADPRTLKRAQVALMNALDIELVPAARASETLGRPA